MVSALVCGSRCAIGTKLVLSLPGFVCLFVRNASFFRIALRDLCRRLVARSTFSTKLIYFKNVYDKSSSIGAASLALHAMHDTVHRAFIH